MIDNVVSFEKNTRAGFGPVRNITPDFILDERGITLLKRTLTNWMMSHLKLALDDDKEKAQEALNDLVASRDATVFELFDVSDMNESQRKNLCITELCKEIYFRLGEQQELTFDVLASVVQGSAADCQKKINDNNIALEENVVIGDIAKLLLVHLQKDASEKARQSFHQGI